MFESISKDVPTIQLLEQIDSLVKEVKARVNQSVEEAKVDGENVIQHKGLKLRKVEREAREGDYVRFTSSNGNVAKNNVIYGPVIVDELVAKYQHSENTKFIVYRESYNRTPSTVEVFEPIGHCKPVEYVAPFPEVLTPNEQRALVINQAKEFVEEHLNENYPISQGYKGIWFVEKDGFFVSETVEFIVNSQKRTVVALIKRKNTNTVCYKGIAKCTPDDVFNEHIGQAIALARALEIDIPKGFLKAVQPDIAVGQVTVTSQPHPYADEPHTIKGYESNKRWWRSTGGTVHQDALIIIDDTNAEYNNA